MKTTSGAKRLRSFACSVVNAVPSDADDVRDPARVQRDDVEVSFDEHGELLLPDRVPRLVDAEEHLRPSCRSGSRAS